MFLLGLVSTFVILSLPARENSIDKQTRLITESIANYRQSAIISGQVIGLRFEGDGYQVMSWLDGGWRPRSGKATLFDGLTVTANSDISENQPDIANWPQIVFDPTGVAVDQTLIVTGGAADFEVLITATGEVSVDAL